MKRVASGHFRLPLPASEAIDFFTPEGERRWVPGWDPVYPDGGPSEAAGTVFTTNVAGVDTIWLVVQIERETFRAAYGRVTPGRHAGMVLVECVDVGDGTCEVGVTYDLTLLPGGDPSDLDGYEQARFQAMMEEWAVGVTATL